VGPLDGRLAQADSVLAAAEMTSAPRNNPLRRGTQEIGID